MDRDARFVHLGTDTDISTTAKDLSDNPSPKLLKSGNIFKQNFWLQVDHSISIATGKQHSVGGLIEQPDLYDGRVPYRIHGECHTQGGGIPYGFVAIGPSTISSGNTNNLAYTAWFGQVHTSSDNKNSCAFIDELFIIDPFGTISSTDFSGRALCFGWAIYNEHTASQTIDVKATLSVQNLAVYNPQYLDRRKQ